MEEIVINELTHEGVRRVKVIGDNPLTPPSPRFAWERVVPAVALDKMKMIDACDQALGIFSMELTWPVFEAYEIFNYGPKRFRRLMMVNFVYAGRVSDCIYLAVINYFSGTRFMPGYAFVSELPRGAEDGMCVHGVQLFEAEWMPARCVAIGGR